MKVKYEILEVSDKQIDGCIRWKFTDVKKPSLKGQDEHIREGDKLSGSWGQTTNKAYILQVIFKRTDRQILEEKKQKNMKNYDNIRYKYAIHYTQ